MKDLDQLKLRAVAWLVMAYSEWMFEPATLNVNHIAVNDEWIASVRLSWIPLVPETETVLAEYSYQFDVRVTYGNHYDTIQDVQDAYFNLYGFDEDQLEAARDNPNRPLSERAHATLMFARDSFVINRCSCCGFYYDNMSHGIICPHCDHRHTTDFPVTRVDEYGIPTN